MRSHNERIFAFLEQDIPMPSTSGLQSRAMRICKEAREAGFRTVWLALNNLETTVRWSNLNPEDSQNFVNRFLDDNESVVVGMEASSDWLTNQLEDIECLWVSRVATFAGFYSQLTKIMSKEKHPKLVLDTADLAYVRHLRGFFYSGNKQNIEEAHRDIRYFTKGLELVDVVVYATQLELDRAKKDFPEASVFPKKHIVRGHASNFTSKCATKGFKYRQLLFVGNYAHAPNVATVEWLLENFPKLRNAIEDLSLAIVGSFMPAHLIARIEATKGMKYLGFLSDEKLKTVVSQSLAFAAPIPFGAGVKTKILDSMIMGLPVIGSSIAWEGIEIENLISGLVANNYLEMLTSLRKLMDETKWKAISNRGAILADELCSFDLIGVLHD